MQLIGELEIMTFLFLMLHMIVQQKKSICDQTRKWSKRMNGYN